MCKDGTCSIAYVTKKLLTQHLKQVHDLVAKKNQIILRLMKQGSVELSNSNDPM
jgi:hypothetical protein